MPKKSGHAEKSNKPYLRKAQHDNNTKGQKRDSATARGQADNIPNWYNNILQYIKFTVWPKCRQVYNSPLARRLLNLTIFALLTLIFFALVCIVAFAGVYGIVAVVGWITHVCLQGLCGVVGPLTALSPKDPCAGFNAINIEVSKGLPLALKEVSPLTIDYWNAYNASDGFQLAASLLEGMSGQAIKVTAGIERHRDSFADPDILLESFDKISALADNTTSIDLVHITEHTTRNGWTSSQRHMKRKLDLLKEVEASRGQLVKTGLSIVFKRFPYLYTFTPSGELVQIFLDNIVTNQARVDKALTAVTQALTHLNHLRKELVMVEQKIKDEQEIWRKQCTPDYEELQGGWPWARTTSFRLIERPNLPKFCRMPPNRYLPMIGSLLDGVSWWQERIATMFGYYKIVAKDLRLVEGIIHDQLAVVGRVGAAWTAYTKPTILFEDIAAIIEQDYVESKALHEWVSSDEKRRLSQSYAFKFGDETFKQPHR